MRTLIKFTTIIFALFVFFFITKTQASAQQVSVSFQVFYDELNPYGQWVDYPNYGYVWVPDAGPDFAPYSSGGHWVLTEYGWTWVSDYNWGWAPFHYGRWDYDSYYGWLWVPDNIWGPSWVTWRRADGYYGWEPMAPGISVNVSFESPYNRHHDHWIFVRDRDFERADIHRYYVNNSEHDRIIRSSSIINRTHVDNKRHSTYISGPDRNEVQRVTGRRVNSVSIQENDRPGQELSNGKLRIYRPEVTRNDNKSRKAAPTRVTNLKDVKRLPGRDASIPSKNATPVDNNRRERQQNTAIPRNNNGQPSQPRNTNSSDNHKIEKQQNNIRPQNDKNIKEQPQQSRKTNQTDNIRKERPQNTAIQKDNNNPARQKQNVSPTENNARVQKQNVSPTDKNTREQKQNSAKPSNESRNRQENNSRSGQDKRR
jgi:hypothetical protein